MKNIILSEFLDYFPIITSRMNEVSHSSNRYNWKSKYHLEGSVWSHTMLVYKEAEKFDITSLYIAALCHDIGKIYTVNYNIEKERVTFYGHERYSLDKAYEFSEYIKFKYPSFNVYTDRILYAIANHMKFGKITSGNLSSKLTHYLQICDSRGRYVLDKKEEKTYDFEVKENYIPKIHIAIFCGLPGSGKDTIAKNENYHIISYDDIREKVYFEATGKTNYSEAWDYCNKNNINLNNYLIKEIKENLGKKIAICNTSLTKKSRKSLINIIKNIDESIHIHCEYVYVPKVECINRDRKREGKSVGKEVIERMFSHLYFPYEDENFDSISVTLNK